MITEIFSWLLSGAIVKGYSNAKELRIKMASEQVENDLRKRMKIADELISNYNISYENCSIKYDPEIRWLTIKIHVFGNPDNPKDTLRFNCTLYNKSRVPFTKDSSLISLNEEFNELYFSFSEIEQAIDSIVISPIE